jgi:hypothetical protein
MPARQIARGAPKGTGGTCCTTLTTDRPTTGRRAGSHGGGR